jgi:hypothetical protein
LNWVEPRERRYYGIDFVKEAEEQVRIIQGHIEVAQSQQKSYANKRRRPITFKVGDCVLEGFTYESTMVWCEKKACT